MGGRKPAGQKNFSASMKSNWQMATRGVPQVVVPGARLFHIFINSLNDRTERQTVDNVMPGGIVNILEGRTAIQMDSSKET